MNRRLHSWHGRVLALIIVTAAFGRPATAQVPRVPVRGVVRDSTGLPLPGTTVELTRAGEQTRRIVTAADGAFTFLSVSAGTYRVQASCPGFQPRTISLHVGTEPPAPLLMDLAVAPLSEQVTVQAASPASPGIESRVHGDTLQLLASGAPSAALSAVVTLAAPGVAADSNGGFHPLGEHAETAVVIDGQPITDQQSRTFSNQLSTNAIDSLTIDSGVPSAEFGGKTSLVANVTTRSGLTLARSAGTISVGYGSFQTPTVAVTFGASRRGLANFVAADAMGTSRFLDAPETTALHDDGRLFEVFDRFDAVPSSSTSLHVNVFVARSAFETPNTFNQTAVGQDQRQRQWTFNIAPAMAHAFGSRGTVELNGWVRRDVVNYLGSADPFLDQPAVLSQYRTLTNAGGSLRWTRMVGVQTFSAGVQGDRTWLVEDFSTGLTDPAFNSPCATADGLPAAAVSIRDPADCVSQEMIPNPDFLPSLLPYDLTRGGAMFTFNGTARIDEWAGYVQDAVARGPWTASAGLRLDAYRGLSRDVSIQPRTSVSYRLARTRSVVHTSYGMIMLTPYNENLVLASSTGTGGFGGGVPGSVGGAPLTTAHRQQVDVGVQQELWRGLQVDAEYFWKRTHGAYDFDVIFNTPLAFPVQFAKSDIDGGLIRVSSPTTGAWRWYATLSHSLALLYGPELGGLRFSADYAPIARPDHDEPLQANGHVEFRPKSRIGFWVGGTIRYDSGLVAVAVPTYSDALRLTGDQQAAMGLYCGSVFATVNAPLRSCESSTFGATRINIPAPGTENDATNPPRIVPHSVVDLAVGFEGLHLGSRRLSARVTVTNAFNAVALYNFLSTFSGTHFVAPRAISAQLTFPF